MAPSVVTPGKVLLEGKDGTVHERWPVDARDMLASGEYRPYVDPDQPDDATAEARVERLNGHVVEQEATIGLLTERAERAEALAHSVGEENERLQSNVSSLSSALSRANAELSTAGAQISALEADLARLQAAATATAAAAAGESGKGKK